MAKRIELFLSNPIVGWVWFGMMQIWSRIFKELLLVWRRLRGLLQHKGRMRRIARSMFEHKIVSLSTMRRQQIVKEVLMMARRATEMQIVLAVTVPELEALLTLVTVLSLFTALPFCPTRQHVGVRLGPSRLWTFTQANSQTIRPPQLPLLARLGVEAP